MKKIVLSTLLILTLAGSITLFALNNKSFNNIISIFFERNETEEDPSEIAVIPSNSVHLEIKTSQSFRLNLGKAEIIGELGVLENDTDISITGLSINDLPELSPDFINVTGEYAGFRMLPHNTKFSSDIEIILPYDEMKIPEGFSVEDIRTYYYDETRKQWLSINYGATDIENKTIISGVNHFTDFINAIIQTPEMPETQNFTPTMMKDIQPAHPLESFTFIEPPQANNNGTANLSYSLDIPAGRQGMQPNLTISYNSAGDLGLLGLGWDLQIPEITIETRWGVPHYDPAKESETYLLNGEQLVRMDNNDYTAINALTHREAWKPRNTNSTTQFCRRVEGSFDKIIRHGTTPKNYYWEVVDKQGIRYFYGKKLTANNIDDNSVLKTLEGNIGKWKLTEIRDLNDNFVYYSYSVQHNAADMCTQIIPLKISYTGKNTTQGKYTINFNCKLVEATCYKKTSARLGFLEGYNYILTDIIIKDSVESVELIKNYRFCYEEGGFKKLLLKRISEVKQSGLGTISLNYLCVSDTSTMTLQEFEYYDMPQNIFSSAEIITELSSSLLSEAAISPTTSVSTSKLGGNSDIGWGTGLASTFGFGLGPKFNKILTLGANFNFTQNFSKGIRTIIDLDGDGLPDRVTRVKNVFTHKVYFEKLSFNANTNTYQYLAPVEITTLSSFSEDVSNSINFGLEAHCGLTVSGDIGNSWNKTKIYFSDINADGLPDIVNGGYVFYNQIVNGVPTFTSYAPDDMAATTFAGGICMDIGMGSDAENSDGTAIVANEIDSEILYKEGRIIETRNCVNEADFRMRHYMGYNLGNISVFLDSLENIGYVIDSFLINEMRYYCWSTYDTIPPEKEIYPPHDLVKIWIAPYNGKINISGDVILTDNLMEKRDEEDSLKISIQVRDSFVFQKKLHIGNTIEVVDTQNISINKGDHIYFRIESMDKKRYDKVFWQPEITYSKYFGTAMDSTKQQLKDANGQYIYKFNASKDFLINPKMEYQMPFNGKINIESEIIISENLSDTVHFRVLKNGQSIYSIPYRNGITEQLNILNLPVNQDDLIVLEAYCKTNVKWNAIKWKPILFYDYINPTVINGTSYNIDAYDSNFNPPKPNVKFDIIPYFSTYPKPINATNVFTKFSPDNQNGFITNNQNHYVDTILINSYNNNVNGILSIKGSDNSVQKVAINFQGQPISAEYPVYPPIFFNDTNTYYLDLYISDTTNLTGVSIVFGKNYVEMGGYQAIGIHSHHKKDDLRFGDMYQNWGQFNYKNTSGDYTDIISPDSLYLSQGLQDTMAYVQAVIESNPNDSATLAYANNIMTNWFSDHPYEQEKFLPMSADYKYNQWVGYGNISYINSDTLSNTIPCVLGSNPDTEFSGDIPIGQMGDEDEIPNNLPENAVKQAPFIKSTSLNISANLSVFGIMGGGATETFFKMATNFIDMNGDRYPDEVSKQEIKYSNPQGGTSDLVKSHTNHGYGAEEKLISGNSVNFGASTTTQDQIKSFRTGKKQENQGTAGSTSFSNSNNHTKSELSFIDLNGDGLPDKISSDGKVLYNLGYSFSTPKDITNVTKEDFSNVFAAGIGLGMPLNICGTSISAGFGTTECENTTSLDLIDINGDGMPDKVASSSNNLYVSFNNGTDYSNSINALNGVSSIFKTINTNNSVNIAVTFGWGTWIAITMNPKAFMNWGVSRVEEMFSDINADGLPDYVYEQNGQIKVRYNQLGKVNLLKSVNNLANGKFTISYKLSDYGGFDCPSRNMVMDSLVVFDGYSGDGENYQRFSFKYDSCYYQRFDRENLGFKTVTTKTWDNLGAVYRIYTEKFHNDKILLKGIKYKDLITNGQNNKYIENNYIYGLHALTDGHYISPTDLCKCDAFPAIKEQLTKYYEGAVNPQITTRERFEYGAYGNRKKRYQDGDIATTADDFTEDITYYSLSSYYMVGKPTQFIVKINNTEVRKITCTIDQNKGNVTQIIKHNNTTESQYDYDYDVYGNIIKETLPKNASDQRMIYTYTYDNKMFTYPVTITDVFDYTSSISYDYKFGKPKTITDINGNTTTYTYDWRGRLIQIKSPMDPNFTVKFEYSLGKYNAIVPWVRTLRYDYFNSANTINAISFSDGLGRIIQNKKDVEIQGVEQRVVSGKIYYDAFGRVIDERYPTEEVISVPESNIDTTIDGTPPTLYQYDILNRVTKITYPNGKITNISYGIDNSSTPKRFKTTKTDALGKTTSKYADARNLPVKLVDALNNTTTIVYDPLGQKISTKDPENLTTSYTYDNLGRCTKRVHPDAGTHDYSYDKAGNLTKTDKNNLITNYIFQYNRILEIQYPANPENNIKYTYGDINATDGRKGRVTQIEDINGWTKFEMYDPFGNVMILTKIVVLPNETNAYQFTMGYIYDSWGRLIVLDYPDNEGVNYYYDKGGNLRLIIGTKVNASLPNPSSTTYPYVNSILYNKFEKRTKIVYGNNTSSEYTYDIMQRLSTLVSKNNISATPNTLQNITYTYDDVGNITKIQNTANAVNTLGGIYTNTYQYDNAYRLTSAGNTQVINGATQTRTNTMDYSANGKIVENAISGPGANVYSGLTSYTYNNNKNTLNRNYINQGPFPSLGTRKIYDYTWSNNGNLTKVEYKEEKKVINYPCLTCPPITLITEQLVSTRNLYWDEEDQLQAISDDDISAYYFYDNAGERSWKTTGTKQTYTHSGITTIYSNFNQSTLYLFPEVTVTAQGYTKHIFAGTERICSKIGKGKAKGLDLYSTTMPSANEITTKRTNQRSLIAKVFPSICYSGCGIACRISGQNIMSCNILKNKLDSLTINSTVVENSRYFYIGDHLGSSAWVCDYQGNPLQHLRYYPYGEILLNQKASGSTYDSPYQFLGNEFDSESGYNNMNARYYWSNLGMFLSVDKMSDKYPMFTPYNYSANNPIMYKDPTGYDIDPAGEKEKSAYQAYRTLVFSSNKYAHIQKELTRLEGAGEVFKIRMGDNVSSTSGGGNFRYNSETGEFDVNIGAGGDFNTMEKLSHELKHADQYMDKKIGFDLQTGASVGYDRNDEIEAYERQGEIGKTLGNDQIHEKYKGLPYSKDNITIENINRNGYSFDAIKKINKSYFDAKGTPRIIYHDWKKDVNQQDSRLIVLILIISLIFNSCKLTKNVSKKIIGEYRYYNKDIGNETSYKLTLKENNYFELLYEKEFFELDDYDFLKHIAINGSWKKKNNSIILNSHIKTDKQKDFIYLIKDTLLKNLVKLELFRISDSTPLIDFGFSIYNNRNEYSSIFTDEAGVAIFNRKDIKKIDLLGIILNLKVPPIGYYYRIYYLDRQIEVFKNKKLKIKNDKLIMIDKSKKKFVRNEPLQLSP